MPLVSSLVPLTCKRAFTSIWHGLSMLAPEPCWVTVGFGGVPRTRPTNSLVMLALYAQGDDFEPRTRCANPWHQVPRKARVRTISACAAHLNEGLGVVALEALVDDPEPGAGAGPPVGRFLQREVIDHQAALAAHALLRAQVQALTLPGSLATNKACQVPGQSGGSWKLRQLAMHGHH